MTGAPLRWKLWRNFGLTTTDGPTASDHGRTSYFAFIETPDGHGPSHVRLFTRRMVRPGRTSEVYWNSPQGCQIKKKKNAKHCFKRSQKAKQIKIDFSYSHHKKSSRSRSSPTYNQRYNHSNTHAGRNRKRKPRSTRSSTGTNLQR